MIAVWVKENSPQATTVVTSRADSHSADKKAYLSAIPITSFPNFAYPLSCSVLSLIFLLVWCQTKEKISDTSTEAQDRGIVLCHPKGWAVRSSKRVCPNVFQVFALTLVKILHLYCYLLLSFPINAKPWYPTERGKCTKYQCLVCSVTGTNHSRGRAKSACP